MREAPRSNRGWSPSFCDLVALLFVFALVEEWVVWSCGVGG